jgi:hypothetical protein
MPAGAPPRARGPCFSPLCRPAPQPNRPCRRHASTPILPSPPPPKLDAADHWEDAIDAILLEFERAHGRRATYTVCHY